MQRLILAEACFFAQFGWTLLILCRCSAAPNSVDSPLKSLILYALALILHALYPVVGKGQGVSFVSGGASVSDLGI